MGQVCGGCFAGASARKRQVEQAPREPKAELGGKHSREEEVKAETSEAQSSEQQPREDSLRAPPVGSGAVRPLEVTAETVVVMTSEEQLREDARKSAVLPKRDKAGCALTPVHELDVASGGAPNAEEAWAASLGTGSAVDIYSNSYGLWCPGIVQGDADGMLQVAYHGPGPSPATPSISTKCLPAESPELRSPQDIGPWLGAVVEVFCHDRRLWLVGVVQRLTRGVAQVAYLYPDATPASEPATEEFLLGHQDLRLYGTGAALERTRAILEAGHDTLAVGSQVEVFSNTLQVWCPGVLQHLSEGIASIAFYYPDMDPENDGYVTKELPLGHQDMRLVQASGSEEGAGGEAAVTSAKLAQFATGRKIEVWSHSRETWLPGHVKAIQDGLVAVIVHYPDVPEPCERVIPAGDADLRLVPGGDAAEGLDS